jgi:rubrerythrin
MSSITFNVDEIFEMAEEIERNGATFYREAAKNAHDKSVQKMFSELAAMEDGHEKIFGQMRKELSAQMKEPTVFDPDNEVAKYLQTMADFHGMEGKAAPSQKFTGKESLDEILRAALQAEKNSIAFYVGIKDLVSEKKGRDKVQVIIIEEMTHVSILGGKLQAIKK